MKRLIFVLTLLVCGSWSAGAWAQKPKIDKMTFRINGKTVTCTIGNAQVSMTLVFNTSMKKRVPTINFGLNAPFTLSVPLYDTTWADDKTFFANFDVNGDVPSTADGLYKFLVSGLQSTGNVTMDSTLSDTLKNSVGDASTLYISRQSKLTANANQLDYGVIKAGTFLDKTLTLTNVTCADINLTRFTLSDPFVILNPPLGSNLAAAANLTLNLRFNPAIRKTYAGTIKINYISNQLPDSLIVPLAGVARGAEIVLVTVPTLNFGTIFVGDSASQTLRLTNRQATEAALSDTLKITSITPNPPAGYFVTPSDLVVAPGDSKNVALKFKPPQERVYNGSLDFVTNDLTKPAGKISLALAGVGKEKTPPPKIDTLLVTWPGGRAGYTNGDFLTICLNVNISEVLEARWKFSPLALPPTTAADTALGGSARFSIVNGKPCFNIPLRNVLPAGRWNFYVWLENRNGVSGYRNANYSQIYYDATAPIFTSLPRVTTAWSGGFAGYTNTNSLTLCWETNDPSGITDVRWKFSKTRLAPTSAADTTSTQKISSNCVTIPLQGRLTDGRWYCYLWLTDGSGNSGFQNAYETVFTYDRTAPLTPNAPLTRNILRSAWFNTRRNPLALNFALSNGNRDAARVRWKFKTRPLATTTPDGESLLSRTGNNAGFSLIFNSANLCGEDSLYYWLADSAGNAIATNSAVTGYKFDMCPPVITRLRASEPLANKRTAFSDTVRIFDHLKVVWDSVTYRFGGARANEPPRRLQRVVNNKNLFIVDIPADGVTLRGVEYKVFAKDSLNNPNGVGPGTYIESSRCSDDEAFWQAVRVRTGADGEFRIDKDGNAVPQPFGSDQSNYALFSVPFELDKNTPKEVLEDDLGAYDRTKWRFYEYRPEMSPNGLIEYNSAAPTISLFVPGRAFFMIVSDQNKVIDSGAGKTVATAKKYVIELKKGWNLFGNPFYFPIRRESLTLINSSIPQDSTRLSIRSYERGWNIDDTIEPWKGYAIYVEPRRLNDKIQLVVCPVASTPRAGKNFAPALTSAKEWTIQIAAQAGAALDTANWFGARSTAAEEYDDFDLLEPPVIGEYVSVFVANENWPLHPMKYTADFRPTGQETYVWPLQIKSNRVQGEVLLQFNGVQNLPAEYEAYLVDAAYGVARNLKHNSAYRVVTGANGVAKTLKLLVGKPETLSKHSGGIALVPTAFELSQNFPNPFAARQAQAVTAIRYALPQAATVTVEMYNMLGQKVRTLVNRQYQNADYYLATWDGRNEIGKEVTSGVYIYRLLAESGAEKFASTKKLLLVK